MIDYLKLFETYAGFIKYGGQSELTIGTFGGIPAMSMTTIWVVRKKTVKFSESIMIKMLEIHADPNHLMLKWATTANAIFDDHFPTIKEIVAPGFSDTLE